MGWVEYGMSEGKESGVCGGVVSVLRVKGVDEMEECKLRRC